MKIKYTFLLATALLCATPSLADCVGGTEFTAANNRTFCISTAKMNYWSAHAWCQGNQLHLATHAEACNNRTFCTGLYCCSNLNYKWTGSSDDAWIKDVDATNRENAIAIEPRDNGVVFSRTKSSQNRVLCTGN